MQESLLSADKRANRICAEFTVYTLILLFSVVKFIE